MKIKVTEKVRSLEQPNFWTMTNSNQEMKHDASGE